MNYISLADSITVLYCAYMMLIGKVVIVDAQTQKPQNRLYTDLGLQDGGIYNPMMPPYNKTHPVEVKLWFRLQHIYGVQDEGALHTNVELIQKWYAENLKWNPGDYDNLNYLFVNEKSVWTPDIIVQNSVLDTSLKLNQFFGEESEKVKVEYTGIVTCRPSYLLKTVCKFDFKNVPYDVQQCPFIMRSVIYDVSVLRLFTQPFPASKRVFVHTEYINETEDVATTKYNETNEWQLEFMISRHVLQQDADEEYYDISLVEIIMSRESGIHSGNVVNPFFYLLVVTLVSVVLPPLNAARIEILLAVMLSYTVLCLVVSNGLPKYSKETPDLTIYLTNAMRYNVNLMTWYCFFFGLHNFCSSKMAKKWWIIKCKEKQRNLKSKNTSGYAHEQGKHPETELEKGLTQEKVVAQENTLVQELQPGLYPEKDTEEELNPVIDLECNRTPVQEIYQDQDSRNDLKQAQEEQDRGRQSDTILEPRRDTKNVGETLDKANNKDQELKPVRKQAKGQHEHTDGDITVETWEVVLMYLNYGCCLFFVSYNIILLFEIWLELPDNGQRQIDRLKESFERPELIDFTETYG